MAVCGEAYAPPRIVFWNLRGDTRGHPVDKDAPNAQLLTLNPELALIAPHPRTQAPNLQTTATQPPATSFLAARHAPEAIRRRP